MAAVSKLACQRVHAKRRAHERYGLMLDREDYAKLVADIQAGKAFLLERQSNRVTVWRVEYAGKTMVAVYDSKRKTIASFLPPEFEEGLRRQRGEAAE